MDTEPELELRTPEEWMEIEDFKILDPDGWRSANRFDNGDLQARSWDEPLSHEEFMSRASVSTISGLPKSVRALAEPSSDESAPEIDTAAQETDAEVAEVKVETEDEEFARLLAEEEEIERRARGEVAETTETVGAETDAVDEGPDPWDQIEIEDVEEGPVFPEPTEGSVKWKILNWLREHQGEWVSYYDIVHPEVGGPDGLRRLREMRQAGLDVETQADEDTHAIMAYRIPAKRRLKVG